MYDLLVQNGTLGYQDTLGTLKPGAEADIAVFTLRKGRFTLGVGVLKVRNSSSLIK